MPKTANMVLLDEITRRSVNLMRYGEHVRGQVFGMLLELQATLIRDLSDMDPLTGPTARQRRRMEALFKQTDQTINSTYGEVADYTMVKVADLAHNEAEFSRKALDVAIPIEVSTVALSEEQLAVLVDDAAVLGVPLRSWWAQQSTLQQSLFRTAVRNGVLRGEAIPELVRRVRAPVSEGGAGMKLLRHHAETLARSAVSTVANAARDETWTANGDLIKSLRWLSTLDSRTTKEFCIPRDGLQYDLETKRPLGHGLPWGAGPGAIHPNCRSTSVPVLKSAKELGLDIGDLPPATRASMNGEVPEDLNYDQWLRTQTEAVQNDALGPRRADLWREGRISSLKDLVGQRGRPLTIAQLEERHPRRG